MGSKQKKDYEYLSRSIQDTQNLLNTFDFQILYFTKETREEVCEVIAAYKKGLPPEIKYTRGLYFRGTI